MATSALKPNYKASWTVIVLAIISFISLYFYLRPSKETIEARAESRRMFLLKVNQNQTIIKSSITDHDVLALVIVSDGTDKSIMATYYCRLAKEEGVEIKMVKILDVSTARLEPGVAYGNTLGKAFCN